MIGYAETWDANARREVGVGRKPLFEVEALGGNAYVRWGPNTRVINLADGTARTLKVPLPELLFPS